MSFLTIFLLCLAGQALASTSTRHLHRDKKRAQTYTTFPLVYNSRFAPTLEALQLHFELKFNLPKLLRQRGLLGAKISLDLNAKLNSSSVLGILDLSKVQVVQDPDWGVAVSKTTNEGNDNAWYSPIQFGTPAQTINLLFDSGSADLIIYDPSCTTCNLNNHTAFNRALSLTYNSTSSVKFQAAYGSSGKTVKGYTGADAVQIGSIKIKNQALAIVTEAVSLNAKSSASGLAGIGPDVLSAIPGTNTVFSSMIKQSLISKPVVGIALVKGTSDQADAGGEYRFGAINPAYVSGEIGWASVSSSYYWLVGLMILLSFL